MSTQLAVRAHSRSLGMSHSGIVTLPHGCWRFETCRNLWWLYRQGTWASYMQNAEQKVKLKKSLTVYFWLQTEIKRKRRAVAPGSGENSQNQHWHVQEYIKSGGRPVCFVRSHSHSEENRLCSGRKVLHLRAGSRFAATDDNWWQSPIESKALPQHLETQQHRAVRQRNRSVCNYTQWKHTWAKVLLHKTDLPEQ